MANFVCNSNGEHYEASNASCEHCGRLPFGEECYDDEGCTWCRLCMSANGWSKDALNNMRDNAAEIGEMQ